MRLTIKLCNRQRSIKFAWQVKESYASVSHEQNIFQSPFRWFEVKNTFKSS